MKMLIWSLPPLPKFISRTCSTATKLTPFPSPNALSPFSVSFARLRLRNNSSRTPWSCSCTEKDSADDLFGGFSLLSPDIPWECTNIWSTFAAYFFSLHIPLSFGGLSVIAEILHQPVLDPLTMAISTLVLQTVEFVGALALLHYTTKPRYMLSSFFSEMLFTEKRSWITAAALGIGFLIGLVLLTSIIADILFSTKDVNNPIVRDILLSSTASKTICFLLYCLITPLLEEVVYRGFLLTSLASMMKWWQAVIISSCVFSVAHFSGENSLQLFLIGCVLGSAYCWSGNLASSFTVHFVYNATILLVTIMS